MLRAIDKRARRLWHRHLLQYLLIAPVAADRRRRKDSDRPSILARQAGRLQRIVADAYTHVPYYRAVLDEIGLVPDTCGTIEQLHLLPFLDREDIQNLPQSLLAQNRSHRWCGLRTSSGTTGRPLLLLKPVESILDDYRGMEWRYDLMGMKRGWLRPMATNYVYISDTEYNPQFRNSALRVPALRLSTVRKYDIRTTDPTTIMGILRRIHRHKPVILSGKPSSLVRLAGISREHDPRQRYAVTPKAILTGAEQLADQRRRSLADAFRCEVFDQYGLTETGSIGCECPAHDGIHYRDDHHLIEIVRDGARVEPGERGEIVVTDLINRLMPLLRYRTGDVGCVTYERCECGSPYPRLKLIEGRLIDFFQSPAGDMVNPFSLVGELRHLNLTQFQLIQTAIDEIEVRYIGDQPPERVTDAIRAAVDARMGPLVRLSARRVSTLDEPGRKTRPYINAIPGRQESEPLN